MKLKFTKRLRQLLLRLLAIMIAVMANAAIAAEPVTVAVTHINKLLEASRPDLPYAQILALVKQRSKRDITYKFGSSQRNSMMLKEQQALCLFPGSLYSPVEIGARIESAAINVAKAYFMGFTSFTADEVLAADGPELMIGFKRGNTFGSKIDQLQHHILVDLNDDSQVVALLEKGRIDLMIGYLPDIKYMLNADSERPILYGDDSLFHTQNDSFLCSDSKPSRAFVAELDTIITKMRNSGELKQILGPSLYLAQ
ncbi:MAG: hypothetical protein ACFHVJ_17875 [Aestuariibacter sp.]